MSDEIPVAPVPGLGIRRFVLTLGGVVLLLYASAWYAVRTEAVKDWVQSSLSRRAGAELTIKTMRVGLFPPTLVLETVETAGYRADAPGATAEAVRLSVRMPRGVRVQVERPVMHFQRGGDGEWLPVFLTAVAQLQSLDFGAMSELTARWGERVALSVKDGSIRWTGGVGLAVSAMDGVGLDVEPLYAGGRYLRYHKLTEGRVTLEAGGTVRDVRHEWLAMGGGQWVSLQQPPDAPAQGELQEVR